MEVRVIDQAGMVSDDIFEVGNGKPDKTGLVKATDSSGKEISINKKRIISVSFPPGKPVLFEKSNLYLTFCPSCRNIVEVDRNANNQATCLEHGVFDFVIVDDKMTTKSVNTDGKTMIETIDAVLGYGELWSKDIKFDHPKVDAKANVLLIEKDGAWSKICFNTFDGRFNKKGGVELDKFLNRAKTLPNVESERQTLLNGKYTKR